MPLDELGRQFKAITQADPCAFCGARELPNDSDHVVGLNDGGSNTWDNLGGVCPACNRSKSDDRLLLFMLRRLG